MCKNNRPVSAPDKVSFPSFEYWLLLAASLNLAQKYDYTEEYLSVIK